jgi:hypothetical protein
MFVQTIIVGDLRRPYGLCPATNDIRSVAGTTSYSFRSNEAPLFTAEIGR